MPIKLLCLVDFLHIINMCNPGLLSYMENWKYGEIQCCCFIPVDVSLWNKPYSNIE